jgi:nitrate/TMAO reductase-like tetraheme cytochrome c subunit
MLGLGLSMGLGLALAARPVAAGRLPGPAPQRRAQPAAERDGDCASCHASIAREWRASYHRMAYSDPDYQRALQREPVPFCRRCHAPEADPAQPADGWAAARGVTCVTCHLLGDTLSSGISRRDRAGRPAHPLRRDPRLSADGACERCHQFQFPDAQARQRPEFMQLSIDEHRRSDHAATPCIDCHMPRAGDGHRSHRFLGGHDAATVRAALRVEAVREAAQLRLRLVPQRVGHALPTGDLFRRLLVEVTDRDAPSQPPQRRYLMRRFENQKQLGNVAVRVTAEDNRLTAARELVFPLAAHRVHLSVRYQRVAFPLNAVDGDAIIDGEIVLHEEDFAAPTRLARR